MTTEQAYEKFLLKTESNISNNNIATDRGRFILLFNEAQNRFIEWTLEKRNENDILQLKQLLVVNEELTQTKQELELNEIKKIIDTIEEEKDALSDDVNTVKSNHNYKKFISNSF